MSKKTRSYELTHSGPKNCNSDVKMWCDEPSKNITGKNTSLTAKQAVDFFYSSIHKYLMVAGWTVAFILEYGLTVLGTVCRHSVIPFCKFFTVKRRALCSLTWVLIPFYGDMCRRRLPRWWYLPWATETPHGVFSTQSSVWTLQRLRIYYLLHLFPSIMDLLVLIFWVQSLSPSSHVGSVSLPSILTLIQYEDYIPGLILHVLLLGSPCILRCCWGSQWPKSGQPLQVHSCWKRSLKIMFSMVWGGKLPLPLKCLLVSLINLSHKHYIIS